MKTAITNIKARLKDAAVKSFGEQLANLNPAVDAASNPTFGDFQSNMALTLSKELKMPPRAIADKNCPGHRSRRYLRSANRGRSRFHQH